MITSYAVYDAENFMVDSFSGPCRLALWGDLPRGWSVERFIGDVSQGMVSMSDVRAHAATVVAH